MATGANLGGINIQFGADIGQMAKALESMEGDLRAFAKRLGQVSLDGVIKGDPFSVTKKHMGLAADEINSVYDKWFASIKKFDIGMDKVSIHAQRNADRISNAFTKMATDSAAALERYSKEATKVYSKATPGLTAKGLGVNKQGKKADASEFDMRKVHSKQFRESLRAYRGFSKEVNEILDKLIEASRKKGALTSKSIKEALNKIHLSLAKDKVNMDELFALDDPRLKHLGEDLQKAIGLQQQLNQVSKIRVAGDVKRVTAERVEKLKAIRAIEKDLLAKQKIGINTEKQLLSLYQRKLDLGVRLNKAQKARVFDVEKDTYAKTEGTRQAKLKEIALQEKGLLIMQATGQKVEQQIVALYQRKLDLGESLTRTQKARMPTAEKEKIKALEEIRSTEQSLLSQKKAGIDVDRQLLQVYERQKALGKDLTSFQKERVRRIQASISLEKNLAAATRESVKAKEEVVQIGRNDTERAKTGVRLQELIVGQEKKEARLLKYKTIRKERAAKLRKKKLADLREITKLERGGTPKGGVYTTDAQIQASMKYEQSKARIIEQQNKEKERQAQHEKLALDRAKRLLTKQEQRLAIDKRISELKPKGKQEFTTERELMATVRAEQQLAKAAQKKVEYQRTSIAIERKAKKEATAHRTAIKQLTAEVRNNYKVTANRVEIYRRLKSMQESGIKLTRKEATELKRLSAVQNRVAATQKRQGSVLTKAIDFGRLTWFFKLRAYWAAYQAIGDIARDVVEAHTQLSRALRTARSELLSTTEVAKQYHQAMKDAVRLHGVGWEDAGEVLYQLGSAGLSAEESMAALHSTLSLIVGTEGDARDVTKAVAGVYNNFGDSLDYVGGEMEKFKLINDTIAKAWKNHQIEISELTEGYKMSVAMTKAAGLSFQELTALLAVANDHMIKGGRAGRALTNVFMRISRTPRTFAKAFGLTKKDFDPNVPLDFIKMMELLSKKIRSGSLSVNELSRNFERLGLRGAPIFTVFFENWAKVQKAIKETDDVRDQAVRLEQVRLDNLAGVWSKFMGTLKAGFQSLTPVVNLFKDSLGGLIETINEATALKLSRGVLSGEESLDASTLVVLEKSLEMMMPRFKSVADLYAKTRREIMSKPIIINGRMQLNPSDLEVDSLVDEAVEKLLKANQYIRKRGKVFTDHKVAAEVLGLPSIADLNVYRNNLKVVEDAVAMLRKALKMPPRDKVSDAIKKNSDYVSDYEQNIMRYLIAEGMIEAPAKDIKKYVEGKVTEIAQTYAEALAKQDWGKIDIDLEFDLSALSTGKDILNEAFGDTFTVENIGPSSIPIEDEKVAKRVLYLREIILEIDKQTKGLRITMRDDAAEALSTLRLTLDEANRSATFRDMEKIDLKRINELESQREGLVKEISDITNREMDSVESMLGSRKRTLKESIKELTVKNAQAKQLGITADEEEDMLANVKKRLALQGSLNKSIYGLGLFSGSLNKDARADLAVKEEAANKTDEEAAALAVINIRRLRTNSLLKEYEITLSRIADIYKREKVEADIVIQTRKDELNLMSKRNEELLEAHTTTLMELAVRKKYIRNGKAQIAIKSQEEKVQGRINDLNLDNLQVQDEMRKQTSIIYDLFVRIEEKSKDINSWWHDLAARFTFGMVDGIADMWVSWISGSQEAQQEVENLKGEIHDLENQRDAIEEKGIFSYEEAQKLQDINKELEDMNDEIKDLQDPLVQAEEQFKSFFKSLIDEINAAIARMIVLRLLSAAFGAASSSYTGSSGAVGDFGTSPGYAMGGVSNRIKAFKRFGSGGVTGNPMMAILGDNPSGKELIIPAENIQKDSVSGYTQESGQPINVVNLLTKQDIAGALAGKEGERVIVNHIGRDLNNNGPIARRLRV